MCVWINSIRSNFVGTFDVSVDACLVSFVIVYFVYFGSFILIIVHLCINHP